MKKSFTILAVALCSTLTMAQTNQYFWHNGNLIMGNPINQIDSITFGQLEQTDSITLYLPHTVKIVHDTVIQYVTIHDTINPCAVPEGAISGKFSVSPTKQVYFSRGNLQYCVKDSTWQFAENQYDYIGKGNVHNPQQEWNSTYNQYCWKGDGLGDIIDLFGWSTDGNPNTAWGVNKSLDYRQYKGNFKDWGNVIEDGWYTLSEDEWNYLINNRPNSTNLFAIGSIEGINGCFLLPDNYTVPKDIRFTSGCTNQRGTKYYSMVNNYTIEQWKTLEEDGVVFLPVAGDRSNLTVLYVQNAGRYWSSTKINEQYSINFLIYSDEILTGDADISVGRSVRLVQEVK